MNRPLFNLTIASIAMAGAGAVTAQTVVPPGIDPGRSQQQFQLPTATPAAPAITLPEISDEVPPESAANTPLTLERIVVDGSSVYSAAALQAMTAPLLGHEIRLLDVFTLADAITARYRRDDYILSRAVIPAQKIEQGVLHLRVVEGEVHAVHVQGPHAALLDEYGAAIVASKPLRRAVLERYLLLMNALPGVTARAVLEPAAGHTGGTNLTVIATEKTVDGFVNADNHGSRYLGPLEASGGIGFNDAFGHGERTSIDYSTADPRADGHGRELDYVEVREDLPLGHDGLLLSVTAGRNTATPGFTLERLDTKTTGTSAGGTLSYPMISSRAVTWTVDAGFSYLNATADINDQPGQAPSYLDQIRALRFGSNVDFADRLGGHNLIGAEFSQGLGILDASDDSRLDISRPGARSGFHKLTLGASRRQELNALSPNLNLLAAVAAQTSFGGTLFSAEQFGVGGATFGRGYDPSEIVGDHGVAGKLELQYNQALPHAASDLQYYGFYDAGFAANVAPAVGTPKSQSLASAGGGARFDLPHGFAGIIEAGKPLTKPVATEVLAGSHDPKRPHVYFSITKRF